MTNQNQIIAAFAIIYNDKNEILLGQRIEPDRNHQFHNKWGAPGGIVDFGETPSQTAIRESQEEAGVAISLESEYPIVRSHIDRETYPGNEIQVILLFYRAKYLSGTPTAKNDKGTKAVKWFKHDEIDPTICTIPENLINELNQVNHL